VDVQLCAQMDAGRANTDICIQSIKRPVDSKEALCSNVSDKASIHEAIQENPSQHGFDGINKAVERIRLDYLLKHDVYNLEYGIKFFSEDHVENNILRYIAILVFIIFLFVGHFSKSFRDERREDVELFARCIILMVERIYHIPGEDVPSFENYCESSKTWSFLYELAPIFVFKCWRKKVERFIRQRDGIVVENMTVNESTPLNIV